MKQQRADMQLWVRTLCCSCICVISSQLLQLSVFLIYLQFKHSLSNQKVTTKTTCHQISFDLVSARSHVRITRKVSSLICSPCTRLVQSCFVIQWCRVKLAPRGFPLYCHVSLCCCSALVFCGLNSRWNNRTTDWTRWSYTALNSAPLYSRWNNRRTDWTRWSYTALNSAPLYSRWNNRRTDWTHWSYTALNSSTLYSRWNNRTTDWTRWSYIALNSAPLYSRWNNRRTDWTRWSYTALNSAPLYSRWNNRRIDWTRWSYTALNSVPLYSVSSSTWSSLHLCTEMN